MLTLCHLPLWVPEYKYEHGLVSWRLTTKTLYQNSMLKVRFILGDEPCFTLLPYFASFNAQFRKTSMFSPFCTFLKICTTIVIFFVLLLNILLLRQFMKRWCLCMNMSGYSQLIMLKARVVRVEINYEDIVLISRYFVWRNIVF